MEPQKPHRIRDVKWSNQDSVKIFEFIKFLENITLENNTLLFNGGPVSLEKQPVLVDLEYDLERDGVFNFSVVKMMQLMIQNLFAFCALLRMRKMGFHNLLNTCVLVA